jgi:hypothetical protein
MEAAARSGWLQTINLEIIVKRCISISSISNPRISAISDRPESSWLEWFDIRIQLAWIHDIKRINWEESVSILSKPR